MSRVAYVNGRYWPFRDAHVAIEDRALQFADGVYEVCLVLAGRVIDWDRHAARLARSLAALRIAAPVAPAALATIVGECVRRNRVGDGLLYLQVTRGTARRDHPFPGTARPTLIVSARNKPLPAATIASGVAVVTTADLRWQRCDIKTTALLANVLAKQEARERGAFEAWLVDAEAHITEGSSTNAWIVTAAGTIVTRPLDRTVLAGVTREVAIELIRRAGLPFEERSFTLTEAFAAAEAFLTSTSSVVVPVVRIDARPVGAGAPGLVTRRVQKLFRDHLGR
ncbi:MAG: D-amino-acid transaminase [Alphaproteobacteria bacterium]|nr:D-amino-acid transaminase [Alphaproteobacteria bacterium]